MNARDRRKDRRRHGTLLKKVNELHITVAYLKGKVGFYESMSWWMRLRRVFG